MKSKTRIRLGAAVGLLATLVWAYTQVLEAIAFGVVTVFMSGWAATGLNLRHAWGDLLRSALPTGKRFFRLLMSGVNDAV